MKDKFGRPDWDTYYLTLALVSSSRSLDQHTHHGCVFVSDDNTLLSIGYNSPPQDLDDDKVPLERPHKYNYMVHAEVNAINNAASHGGGLKGSTVYITGHPCRNCFISILRVKPKRIVYGGVSSNRYDEDRRIVQEMLSIYKGEIEFVEYDNHDDIVDLLSTTKDYYKDKLES